MNNVECQSKPEPILSTIPLLLFSVILSSSLPALFLSPASAYGADPELLIATAADLSSVQEPLSTAFRSATGCQTRIILGSSGMLAQQIRQGAPYDIYLSANETFVSELAASGHLLPDSVRTYALGRIALWSKTGAVRTLPDLAKPGVLHVAIANPAHAPYGVAARQALVHEGLWGVLERKIVYGENVRQAVQYAESGNADAAITAWSLVSDRGGVLLPDAWHTPIRQGGGIVKGTRHLVEARRFMEFLASPAAVQLLGKYGLFPPPAARGK